MLRRLRITEASFTSDIVAFGGVTSVDLAHVTIAADLCFLKNLKELRLSRITYKFGDATVNKLGDHPLCQPVLLPKLSSFYFFENRSGRAEAIIGMITAPRLSHSYFESTSIWIPHNLPVLSPLSTELLRHHSEYKIIISSNDFVLSTRSREGGLQPSSRVAVNTWGIATAYRDEIPLKLLQDFEEAAPPSASVDLVFGDASRPARLVLEYLKSTKESTCGISDNPLPQLRSIQSSQQCGRFSFLDIELIILARARRNPPKITIHSRGIGDGRVTLVSQLDPESFSFIPVK
ncbi:hypothetical protein FRC05_003844 [Tulasnella sp. 425]|nr:hypothetical protein FRC05_003844 [Tulasnella sp. 425]